MVRRIAVVLLAYCAVNAASLSAQTAITVPADAWQIVQLANQARAAQGAGPLQWDVALGEAARQHCLRMAAEGPIAHRYGGEPALDERAAQAGARFSLIEENVAVGPTPAAIHDEWMNSPGHRTNLLNPQVDRVGVALVASRGVLYAVADYSRSVLMLSPEQAEAAVAGQLRNTGLALASETAAARAVCAAGRATQDGPRPGFIMLWQEADLTHLPQALLDRIASGRYSRAAVGNCPTQNVEGAFTAYRIAVLLY